MVSPARRAIGYPTNRLLAVIDDPAEGAAALAELTAVGIATRDLEILRGDEGARWPPFEPQGGSVSSLKAVIFMSSSALLR